MRIKQRPEDFSVKESYRFDEVEDGRFRVYLMDKQKLSTFDALARLRERFGLKPGAISYCGLKDKQGRTEQLIAVDGKDIDFQDADLRLKFLGHTDKPLSAANTTSNRFAVTVRAVKQEELDQINLSVAEVNRLGVVNYYDSQRFGSIKHGQGYIAKDLIRGDFEAALKNYLARPSPLDRSEDSRVKQFWAENWNQWDARCPYPANKKYFRILNALRDDPKDYLNAFLQIDSDYRALILFTFQSYLWNEGVRRLLQLTMPREHLFPMPYQAGTLLFPKDAEPKTLDWLRKLTFPLLAPNSTFTDPRIQEAAEWALGKEHLKLEQLAIPASNRLLYFKHEERPVLVYPHKLVLGRTFPDEMNKPLLKLAVAFTLPPGSYATLVVKRLFHFGYRDDTADEIRATQDSIAAAAAEKERPGQFANRKDAPAARKVYSDDGRSPRHGKRPDRGFDRSEQGDRPKRPDRPGAPARPGSPQRPGGPHRPGGPARPGGDRRPGSPQAHHGSERADAGELPEREEGKKARWVDAEGKRKPRAGREQAPRPAVGPQRRKSSKPYKK